MKEFKWGLEVASDNYFEDSDKYNKKYQKKGPKKPPKEDEIFNKYAGCVYYLIIRSINRLYRQ